MPTSELPPVAHDLPGPAIGCPPAAAVADYDPPLTSCPLCGGRSLQHRLTDCRGHHIVRCRSCAVEFMNPQYSDGALQRLYAGYINLHSDEGADRHRSHPAVRRAGKLRSLQLLAQHAPGKRILMVGCGDGLELQVARQCGWQPEGYDVDQAITAAVGAREGVPVHCGDFHTLPARCGRFDAIFLDQVIEHPKDPGRCLQTCHELLRPRGVVFLGVPNLGSLSNRLKTLADRWRLRRRPGRHYNTRHHLTFFRPALLARFLREQLGMQVLCVRSSLKPQRNPLVGVLARCHPLFDSSFFVVARRAQGAAPVAAAAANAAAAAGAAAPLATGSAR